MDINFFFLAEKPFQKSTYLGDEVCLFWLLQEAAWREMRRKQYLDIFLLLFFVLICTIFLLKKENGKKKHKIQNLKKKKQNKHEKEKTRRILK